MDGNCELIMGDKNYSSWSLRPWLVLASFEIPFKETHVKLRRPDTRADILRHSPSGKVPALRTGDLVIWDSLAIMEFLAERHPNANIWPREEAARAIARCVSAEMHSGFSALRKECPMDFVRVHGYPQVSDRVEADIARIVEVWKDSRRRFGHEGEFLFGAFSAADAMYAPVASRFVTYEVDLARFGDDGTAATYRDAVMAMVEMRRWADEARAELAADAR